jgi:hypothetical protein
MATIKHPVGSSQRLQELGLPKDVYGSCSGHLKKAPGGPFDKVLNRGCRHHPDSGGDCEWAMGTALMSPADENDVHPRPRMCGTRLVKPSATEAGDSMRESFCSCVQWNDDLRRKDGKNKVLTEVVCGEGGTVTIRDSRIEVDAAGTRIYIPERKEVTVPRYPDPSSVPELSGALDAGRVRTAGEARKRREERESRIGPAFVASEGAEPREGKEVEAHPIDVI